MYQVSKINRGITSSGNISLVRSRINLLMCIVLKYLKLSWKNEKYGSIPVIRSILVNFSTKTIGLEIGVSYAKE